MDHSIESTIARIQEHAAGSDNDKVANILVDLMPGPGLALVAGEDYQRAQLLIGIVSALVAYCDEWESIAEPDVLADVAAYAAMLNTIDGRRRKREKNFIRMADASDDFAQKWAAGQDLSTEEAIKAANATLGASDALSAWAAQEAERIFPTPAAEQPGWWRDGGPDGPTPMESPPGPGPSKAYYSHIVGSYWGTVEQAADFYRRRRADNFPTPPVDSAAATDETPRRQGYAPSS